MNICCNLWKWTKSSVTWKVKLSCHFERMNIRHGDTKSSLDWKFTVFSWFYEDEHRFKSMNMELQIWSFCHFWRMNIGCKTWQYDTIHLVWIVWCQCAAQYAWIIKQICTNKRTVLTRLKKTWFCMITTCSRPYASVTATCVLKYLANKKYPDIRVQKRGMPSVRQKKGVVTCLLEFI
jgi:hypothetical protein